MGRTGVDYVGVSEAAPLGGALLVSVQTCASATGDRLPVRIGLHVDRGRRASETRVREKLPVGNGDARFLRASHSSEGGTMLRRIAWSSALATSFSAARLNKIIAPARLNNERLHMSGMLVFTGSHFLGIYEGDERDLGRLWLSLRADVRHCELTRIGDEVCGQRWFPTWLVGYSDDPAVNKQIEAFRALQMLMASQPESTGWASHPPAQSTWAQVIRPIVSHADSM